MKAIPWSEQQEAHTSKDEFIGYDTEDEAISPIEDLQSLLNPKEYVIRAYILKGKHIVPTKKTRDVNAYLRLATQPNDSLALERIINTPKRGIGETSVKKRVVHMTA